VPSKASLRFHRRAHHFHPNAFSQKKFGSALDKPAPPPRINLQQMTGGGGGWRSAAPACLCCGEIKQKITGARLFDAAQHTPGDTQRAFDTPFFLPISSSPAHMGRGLLPNACTLRAHIKKLPARTPLHSTPTYTAFYTYL